MIRIVPCRAPRVGALASALLAVVFAAPVSAAEETRSSSLQLTMADYQPSIDEQFGTSPGPYELVFGSESAFMFEVAFEGHLIENYGALTAGLSLGYWNIEGTSLLENGSEGADSTAFQILPIAVQLSYRFDMFAEQYFPLAPIVRLGLDYYLWRILDGEDNVAYFSPGNEAQGSTYGWHATIGLHLLLDFFSLDMANAFERNAGVYNSFLVAEYRYSQIDEFGSATSFRLGDGSFIFGLALEL